MAFKIYLGNPTTAAEAVPAAYIGRRGRPFQAVRRAAFWVITLLHVLR